LTVLHMLESLSYFQEARLWFEVHPSFPGICHITCTCSLDTVNETVQHVALQTLHQQCRMKNI